jgi:aryl-phospho-beta-D-glucosidase BglC (GH1 family)
MTNRPTPPPAHHGLPTAVVLSLAASLAACSAGSHSPVGSTSSAASTTGALLPSGYLTTSGNQITDLAGNPVRLACVGYFAPGDITADVQGMVAAGFNCLRYPWYDATMSSNLATADQIAMAASAVGLKVILDHHGNEVPGANNGYLPYPCNGLPFDTGPGTDGTDGCGDTGTISRAQYVQDWTTVAQHFAGNPTVIGCDLTNEPHLAPAYWSTNPGGATWGDGSATDLRAIYEQAGDAIQSVNPGVLLIAEGIINFTSTLLDGSPLVTAGGDLTLAGSMPVSLNIANQVVYSIHDYPATIGGTSPDSGAAHVQEMNTNWGYLVSQNVAPVWIGEMGASLDDAGPDSTGSQLPDEQAWASTLVSYLNGQQGSAGGPTFSGSQQGISTSWWAWGDLTGESPDGTLDSNGNLRPQQSAVYSQLQYVPSAPPAPPPAQTESASGTTIPSASQIVDAQGNVWTVSGGVIDENGEPAGYSANVTLLLYDNHVVYQENAAGGWWSWNGSWVATSDPRPAASPSGTTIPSAAQITDAGGNVWTLSAGVVLENGTAAGYSANVSLLLYYGGAIYQENTAGGWWTWDGTANPPWVGSSDPR